MVKWTLEEVVGHLREALGPEAGADAVQWLNRLDEAVARTRAVNNRNAALAELAVGLAHVSKGIEHEPLKSFVSVVEATAGREPLQLLCRVCEGRTPHHKARVFFCDRCGAVHPFGAGAGV